MGNNGNGNGNGKSNGNGKFKKKFLIVSDIGCIGDLAYQIKNEGNKVLYYIKDKDEKSVSDGFLEKALLLKIVFSSIPLAVPLYLFCRTHLTIPHCGI